MPLGEEDLPGRQDDQIRQRMERALGKGIKGANGFDEIAEVIARQGSTETSQVLAAISQQEAPARPPARKNVVRDWRAKTARGAL